MSLFRDFKGRTRELQTLDWLWAAPTRPCSSFTAVVALATQLSRNGIEVIKTPL